jgi:hypothetical protein
MAGKVREIVVHPPIGGVVRSYDFQAQPPYTAVNAINVWGRDGQNMRQRCAVRPGLASFATVASSNSVRCLAQVNVATQQTYTRGLFAISNGLLYRYSGGGFTNEGGTFSTDRLIVAAPYLQKLYIARSGARPSVYDCVGDTLGDIAISPGSASALDSCTIVVSAFDRLWWSGNPSVPHGYYASRVGTPLDYEFDLDSTDVTQAINGTTLDGGNIGEKITALMPHSRECLLLGGSDSVHIIRGDPMQGGRMAQLSDVVGPLGQSSWCKTADGSTVMLSRNGLYVMPDGCGAPFQRLSQSKIPDSLMGIDPATYTALLSYDARFGGVHIYTTETAGASSGRQAWWLDWENGGFWPMELTTTEQPHSIIKFDPLDGADVSGVLLGGSGGGVRRLDRTTTGAVASGYLYIGPIKISPTPFHKGNIQKMRVTFGANTNDTTGTVAVYCAESGEAAYTAAVAGTAARKFGLTVGNLQNNHVCHPRVGGHAAVIKIALTDATKYWSLEEIALTVKDEGLYR